MDFDKIFLLLSVVEKAAGHGAKYNWIATAALAELDKLQPEASDGTTDTE